MTDAAKASRRDNAASTSSTEAEATGRAGAARERDRPSRPALLPAGRAGDLRRRLTTRWSRATARSRRASRRCSAPTARASRSAPRRRRASPRSRHALPMLSLDNAFDEEDVREFFARVRRFLGLEPRTQPIEVVGRAQDRRAVGRAALRGRPIRAGRDPRRRRRSARTSPPISGRWPTCPHACKGSHAPTVLEVRGEVYMRAQRLRQAQRSARQAAGEPLFANPRNAAAGSAAPARSRDHRGAAAAFLRLCAGARSSEATARRDPVGIPRAARSWGFRGQSAGQALPRRRRALALPAQIGERARRAALRHRRRRLQGQPARLAGAAGLGQPRAALGDRA